MLIFLKKHNKGEGYTSFVQKSRRTYQCKCVVRQEQWKISVAEIVEKQSINLFYYMDFTN